MSDDDLHLNRPFHWTQEGRGQNQSEEDPLYPSIHAMSPVKIDAQEWWQQQCPFSSTGILD